MTLAALAAAAPAAGADERIVARPTNTYATPNPTIDQGERLTFQNTDVAMHNVTSRRRDGAGQPLFRSATIAGGREVEVEGARFLTTGAYGFYCTIHPFMTGTLTVSAAGTPLQRPGDATPPALRVAVARTRLARVRRSRRLPVRAFADEPAALALRATARVRGRTVTLAQARLRLDGSGTERAALALTRAGRRAVAHAGRLTVTLRGVATDAAGNESAARARRTLR